MRNIPTVLTLITLVLTLAISSSADGQTESPEQWRKRITAEAQELNVVHIEQLENGVYGHYKQSRVFFTIPELVPDDTKLYWAMIKILSEKFACFMVKKRKSGNLYRFYCKDKRSVVFRKGRVGKTVHFYGRTYDENEKLIPLTP